MINTLSTLAGKATSLARDSLDSAASVGKSAVESTAAGAQSSVVTTTAFIAAITKAPKNLASCANNFTTDQKAKIYSALFTVIDLEVWAVPVGVDPNDIEISYDHEQFRHQLTLNPLSVPRILLTTGRSDLNLERLQSEVQAMLKEDYEASSSLIRKEARKLQTQNRDELTHSLGSVVRGTEGIAFWFIIGLLSGPFAPLVLCMAFGNGVETISEIVSLPRKGAKAAAETIFSPVSATRSAVANAADNIAASRSIKNFELVMHTELMQVVEILTGSVKPFRAEKRVSHDFPPDVQARVNELLGY